jgi:hypothetical protein
MKAVKAASSDAVRDSGFAQARVEELSMGDDSILPSGEKRDRGVNRHNVTLDALSAEACALPSP